MRKLSLIICFVMLAAAASADTFTADFEGGTNIGGWTFNGFFDSLNATGGNPGGWYGSAQRDTWAPIFKTTESNGIFTGNYFTRGVTRISGDFKTDNCDNKWANTYNFTILLRNDGGTPGDETDDFYVYPDPFANLIPQVSAGWTHYDFAIPSDFVGGPGELPAGWMGGSYMTGLDVFPSDKTFQDVMTTMTTVEFWWIHPAFWSIYAMWDIGADNITIEYGAPIPVEHATWGDVKALYR